MGDKDNNMHIEYENRNKVGRGKVIKSVSVITKNDTFVTTELSKLSRSIVKYESYDFLNEHIIELDCTKAKCEFDYLRFTFKSILYDTEVFLDKVFTNIELYKMKDGFRIIFSIYKEEDLKIEDKTKGNELCYIIEAKELIIEEIQSIFAENDTNEYLNKLITKQGDEFKLETLQQWMDNEDIGYYYRFNELISMSKVITDEYDRLKEDKNLRVSKDLQYFVENFDFRECKINDFGMKGNNDFYIEIEKGSNYFEFNEDKPDVELVQVTFKGTKKVEANNTGFIDSCCIKIDYDHTIEFQLLVETDGYDVIKVHAEDLVIDFMK